MKRIPNGKSDEFIELILGLFEEMFEYGLSSAARQYRTVLLQYMPLFFSKWFYSTLLEGFLLSPANLLLARADYDGEPVVLYPYLRLTSDSSIFDDSDGSLFEYELRECSTRRHPVIEDLKTLIDFCKPTADLNDSNIFESLEFINKFNIPVLTYTDYLTEIALNMKLLAKLPSINSMVVQPSDYCASFFENDTEQILTLIVEATLKDCSKQLNKVFPTRKTTTRNLMEILTEPAQINEIFNLIFNSEIDAGGFYDFNESDGFFGEIMNMTQKSYLVGVTLDQYFFTPLSYYLKIIQPIYMLPDRLYEDFGAFCTYIEKNASVSPVLFYTCSGYALTPLGRELYSYDDDSGDEYLLPNEISPRPAFGAIKKALSERSNLKRNLDASVELPPLDGKYFITQKLLSDMNKGFDSRIITLKLMSEKFLKKPVVFEIYEDSTLHYLHAYICSLFEFDPSSDYCFHTDESNSQFTTYSSWEDRIVTKRTTVTTLKKLELDKYGYLRYVLRGTPFAFSPYDYFELADLSFEISVSRISGAKYGKLYPWEKT